MSLFNKHKKVSDTFATETEDLTERIISSGLVDRSAVVNKSKYETEEELAKAYGMKKISYVEPIKMLGNIDFTGGFAYRPSKGSPARSRHTVLKEASRNIIVNAIITTRANQVAQFAQPARLDSNGVGFEVVLKDKQDTTKLKGTEEERIRELEDFLNNLGSEPAVGGKNFRFWTRQIVRDILTYDQTNSEIVYDENGTPVSFSAVDASTIFYAANKDGSAPTENDYAYVQVVDETTAVGFKKGELTFNIMNPRTDIYAYQYGLSPLEVSLAEVGYHDMTEEFNAKYFSQGGTTMGVLQIKTGDGTTAASLEDFRRDFTNFFGGVNGAWRIPVIAAEDVKYINMNQSSRDMQFESWLSYLINAIASNFQIDAQEVGFQTKGIFGKSGNSLQEASKREASELSQNKGLKPLLDFIEDIINFNIMDKFYDGKYMFRFKGDDLSRRQQELDIIERELKTFKGLNEIRLSQGLPRIDALDYDIPMNPVLIQRLGQQQAQVNADRDFEFNKQQADRDYAESQKATSSDNEGSEGNQSGTENDRQVTTQDKQQALSGNVSSPEKDPLVKKDGTAK